MSNVQLFNVNLSVLFPELQSIVRTTCSFPVEPGSASSHLLAVQKEDFLSQGLDQICVWGTQLSVIFPSDKVLFKSIKDAVR